MPKLKKETEVKADMNQRVIKNINILMERSHDSAKPYTQNGFCRFCESTYQVQINQGNLSAALNPERNGHLNTHIIYYMSRYLNVDMENLMWSDYSANDTIISLLNKVNSSKESNLIFDISQPCFEHYLGSYECYFYPTKSDESKLLHGRMLIKEDWVNLCCRVEIELDTNTEIEGTDDPYIKKYKGILFISKELNTCYCLVENAKMGECNFISFRYVRKPNNMDYLGGMAAVVTVSAGSDNVPTMHRMLISRTPVDQHKLEYLRANLLLNQSKILIPKSRLLEIMEQLGLPEETKNRIVTNAEETLYCEISERTLRDIKANKLNNKDPFEFLSMIRAASYALRYNKISKKLDENVLRILNS